jgi:hypothetical protein
MLEMSTHTLHFVYTWLLQSRCLYLPRIPSIPTIRMYKLKMHILFLRLKRNHNRLRAILRFLVPLPASQVRVTVSGTDRRDCEAFLAQCDSVECRQGVVGCFALLSNISGNPK